MKEVTGWLFDLYEHPQKGAVLWIVDEKGKPHRFHHDFEITFYAGGPSPRLRELWIFLRSRKMGLKKVTRDDLFDGPQEVMQIRVPSPAIYKILFREVKESFPDLTYYDEGDNLGITSNYLLTCSKCGRNYYADGTELVNMGVLHFCPTCRSEQ